jgi:hypothetical protein
MHNEQNNTQGVEFKLPLIYKKPMVVITMNVTRAKTLKKI